MEIFPKTVFKVHKTISWHSESVTPIISVLSIYSADSRLVNSMETLGKFLTLLHSERLKLFTVLAFLNAVRLNKVTVTLKHWLYVYFLHLSFGGGRVEQRCWVNSQCRGVLLVWMIVGQGPIALAVGADGGCLDIFSLIYLFSFLSPSLWETARYRLKYCLKGPLNPKQPTNQPTFVFDKSKNHFFYVFQSKDMVDGCV